MVIQRMKLGLATLVGCLMLVGVQASDQFLGTWSGTWEGGGAGGSLVLTIAKSGGALGGKVDVGQDTGDYSSTFSSASFDGSKFTARYDYTPDPQAEIVLEGAFQGDAASGTWTMVQKGGSDAFSAGNWSVKKK